MSQPASWIYGAGSEGDPTDPVHLAIAANLGELTDNHGVADVDRTTERSWVNRFDFAMKGNLKGTALERYAKRIGVSSDKVVAVGDNFNDLSMLQYAGLGIAMKNSADAVKEHAQLITEYDHDSEAGLAELLSSIFEHQ